MNVQIPNACQNIQQLGECYRCYLEAMGVRRISKASTKKQNKMHSR